jgi:hypothetical protein
VTGCPEFFGRLVTAVTGLGAGPVTLVSDPAAATLAAMARLAVTDPMAVSDPRAGREIWHLDLAGRVAEAT